MHRWLALTLISLRLSGGLPAHAADPVRTQDDGGTPDK